MRLAVDWGDVRIGVARSDPAGVLAFPLTTVRAGPGETAALVALVAEHEPMEMVVGLPIGLNGAEGIAARKVRVRTVALARALAAAEHAVPVRLVDERLSTTAAARSLRAAGRRGRQARAVIDEAAAVAILEHALRAEAASGAPPGQLLFPEAGRP